MRPLAPEAALDGRLLRGVAPEVVSEVREVLQMRQYEQGEVMYRIGDPIPGPCFVEGGLAGHYWADDWSPKTCALVRWPGEISALTISGETTWPVCVVALTPLVWGVVSSQIFQRLQREQAQTFPRLFERLARQHYRAVCWMARLSEVRVRRRLRLVLHRLAQELGTSHEGGLLLDFRVTREVLATIAGANVEEMGRALGQMSTQGLVARRGRRRLWIPDPDRLLD
jgi:CRP-like cAMP-binding protein